MHVGVEIFLFRWLWLLRKWNQKGVLFSVVKMIGRIISSSLKGKSGNQEYSYLVFGDKSKGRDYGFSKQFSSC